mmetsp:Transcript_34740/g.47221  ORF Transcript_34740/g.47221 Transcript_34740/m.47221 type:complete len:108 (+) Transcript_34740:195-518(+)
MHILATCERGLGEDGRYCCSPAGSVNRDFLGVFPGIQSLAMSCLAVAHCGGRSFPTGVAVLEGNRDMPSCRAALSLASFSLFVLLHELFMHCCLLTTLRSAALSEIV